MYPWEHAAVAYLCYTVYARWRTGTAPAGWAVLVVLTASQFPDLIDKPLAWQVGLVASGRAVAHSLFVAVPLALVARVLARRHGRGPLGTAFAVGTLSHLVADVIPLSADGSLQLASVGWPVVPYESAADTTASATGAVAHTSTTVVGAYPSVAAGDPTLAVLGRLGLVGLAGVVWLSDGRPGGQELRWGVRMVLTAIRARGRRGRS
ncbi:metal-dependent hydrolase [Haloterrigena turkmenica]|nr:metal-dependent hydrolase [Haloterrigena turkmenica]